MKRLVSLLLILCFLLGFCSCKKEEQNPLFAEGSIAITAENLPKIAVTTANSNIAINLVSAILNCTKTQAKEYLTVCKTPDECYEMLANGECDVVIAHESSTDIEQLFGEKGVEMLSSTVAKDALVFTVSEQNTVANLSTAQLRDIYSATVTDWSAVGGAEGEIKAFMQNKGSAAETAFKKYINADTSLLKVPTKAVKTEDGEFTAALEYDNGALSIGFALYYDMITPSAEKNGNYKMLNVDGVKPEGSTIQSGTYPCVIDIKVAVGSYGEETSTVKLFYDWILGEQGKQIIANSGVIPV